MKSGWELGEGVGSQGKGGASEIEIPAQKPGERAYGTDSPLCYPIY